MRAISKPYENQRVEKAATVVRRYEDGDDWQAHEMYVGMYDLLADYRALLRDWSEAMRLLEEVVAHPGLAPGRDWREKYRALVND